MTDDEIRALIEASTPGPWGNETVRTSCGVCHKIGPWPHKWRHGSEMSACIYDDYPSPPEGTDNMLANARLIAAAPSLAAEVLRLREIQQMRVLAVLPWTHEKAADTYSAAIDAVKHIARAALKRSRTMTPFPDCPTPEQAKRAAEHLFDAAWEMAALAKGEGSWDRASGHIQDGLREVGLEPRPLNPPAPATAEAYGPNDYAASVGGDVMGDKPKPRPCATESCDRPAVIRFERGNVGSDYCAHCYAKMPLPEAPQ